MRVSLEHLELAMSGDAADLRNIEAFFEEARDRLVPQIVKMKVTFRARTRCEAPAAFGPP
jgi:hypothetical protein